MSQHSIDERNGRIMAYWPAIIMAATKRYPRNREAAYDLAVDTVMECRKNWDGFREDGGFYNWIMWQLRGALSNSLKRLHSDKAIAERDATRGAISEGLALDIVVDPASMPQASVSAKMMINDILKTSEGEALVLTGMGYNSDEIARMINKTPSNVRNIIAQGRAKLRGDYIATEILPNRGPRGAL